MSEYDLYLLRRKLAEMLVNDRKLTANFLSNEAMVYYEAGVNEVLVYLSQITAVNFVEKYEKTKREAKL